MHLRRPLDGFADFRERFWLADYVVLALAVALFTRLLLLPTDVEASLPDLRSYEPDVRKEMFLDFLTPIAVSVNEALLVDRRVVEAMASRLDAGERLSWLDRMRLGSLAERYAVDIDGVDSDAEAIDVLLRRADVIPIGLILAQAAVESGWGTSRFAIEGNNLFGQRCYRTGCGLEPQNAGDDPGFYVAEFHTDGWSRRVLGAPGRLHGRRPRDHRSERSRRAGSAALRRPNRATGVIDA